jgi:hypothetical protein
MSPQRADLVLTSNVPYIELDILVRHSLHIEAYCRDGGDVLVELKFVEDSCADVRMSLSSATGI